MITDKDMVDFNVEKYRELKRLYKLAEGKERFIFEDREILAAYARYLLEYLGTKFKDELEK